jgi:hypothetical protein
MISGCKGYWKLPSAWQNLPSGAEQAAEKLQKKPELEEKPSRRG